MTCIVDMDIRRYADEQGDESEFEVAVEQRKGELMAGEYAPLRADNFEEAITESMIDPLGGMPAAMVKLLAGEHGPYIVARLLLAVATSYMSRLAELKAETDLLSGVAA